MQPLITYSIVMDKLEEQRRSAELHRLAQRGRARAAAPGGARRFAGFTLAWAAPLLIAPKARAARR